MSLRSKVWPPVAAAAIVSAAAVLGVIWYRGRPISTAAMLKRLPSTDALILAVDFDALRNAGILQLLDGSKAGEDPDYRRFVHDINFDYRRDLDAAYVAFGPDGTYMLVRGRFDWKSLHAYVKQQGGSCVNALCKMRGSGPQRQISFFELQAGVMGLAVSPEGLAARRLQQEPSGSNPEIPGDPVWLSVPTSFLRSGQLPEGTHMFARSIERAERVTLALSAAGSQLTARLDVRCHTGQEAEDIASQLTQATIKLREMIQREHQTPNPADLSGVLSSGSFRSEGRRVIGSWPIDRRFVENVLGGGLP